MSDPHAERDAHRRARRKLRKMPHPPVHLPLAWRIFFIVSGWLLVIVGVAGLALPGIQGILTLVLGAALLSLASETAYWLLRAAFRRWPKAWRRMERWRRKIYRRIVGAPGERPHQGRAGGEGSTQERERVEPCRPEDGEAG